METPAPAYKLDVAGPIRTTSNLLAEAVGINTTTPLYLCQVNNGSYALYNTSDSKYWTWNYTSGGNYVSFKEDGSTSRLVIANGGNVGIGNLAPTVKLDVTGSGRFTDNLTVDDNLIVNDNVTVDNNIVVNDNVTVGNNVTVNGGKRIIRNTGSSQLRYLTFQAPFTVNLPAHGSLTANIVWNAFNSPPVAFAGNIVISGGTSGELYRCILQLYNVTATGCDCKIINTDNAAINQTMTWNVVCIGN